MRQAERIGQREQGMVRWAVGTLCRLSGDHPMVTAATLNPTDAVGVVAVLTVARQPVPPAPSHPPSRASFHVLAVAPTRATDHEERGEEDVVLDDVVDPRLQAVHQLRERAIGCRRVVRDDHNQRGGCGA